MRKYLNKPVEELAAELSAGLLRLRKGYVDAAESLLRIIEPANDYPYEFLVYRLTGYRPRGALPSPTIPGKTLRGDLQRLMLDVCDSFELRPGDYAEPVYDVAALTRQFNISTKTLTRWRRMALPARRMVFPSGKRRIAFLDSSVQWYVRDRRSRILRSMRFSQMTAAQRNDIIRRARRMAAFTRCSLGEVVRRLAARTGRAAETIRYTIRNYDRQHGDQAIFPHLSGPIAAQDRQVIYRCFLSGVSAPALARQYKRTRGSIYRIINEMRAGQLASRPIEYIYNPQFDLPNADEIILTPQPAAAQGPSAPARPADNATSGYLQSLYDVPLLSAAQERDLFRRLNYLKHKADHLRRRIDMNHVRSAELKHIESLLLSANMIKNQIVRANLRLVVSISRKHLRGPQDLLELTSDGNVSLMRAVEKFDYSRGYRFSTYASWAIMRNFARSVPKEKYQLNHFATGNDEILDIASSMARHDPAELNLSELRESLDSLLARLTPRERSVLIDHYGLDRDGQGRTLDEMGKNMGLSKERVRQIEMKALAKLRGLTEASASGNG